MDREFIQVVVSQVVYYRLDPAVLQPRAVRVHRCYGSSEFVAMVCESN